MYLVNPPVDMSVNMGAERVVLSIMTVLALSALIFSLIHWRRSGQPTVFMLVIAGSCMMVMEPMVDTVAACWFPKDSIILFEGWSRPIPLWVCVTYVVYFGLGGGTNWLFLKNGVGERVIWVLFAGSIVADTLLETVLLHLDLYTYYSSQPLRLGEFPMWWAAVNSLISVAAAVVALKLSQYLSGWHQIAIVPAILCTSAAMNAAAGFPSWYVINTDVGPFFTQLGGILTFAFASGIVFVLGRIAASPPQAKYSDTTNISDAAIA